MRFASCSYSSIIPPMFEIRYNPIAGEWVIVAAGRMKRPVLPSKDACPFCPGVGKTPSDYDVYVYKNDYPSMSLSANSNLWTKPQLAIEDAADHPQTTHGDERPTINHQPPTANVCASKPSFGACEVILYSPRHDANIYDLPEWHIKKLVECWKQRTSELGAIDGINYVFIFENRGEAVGVTIHHPHGQIYAFPFVPRKIAQEMQSCREYAAAHPGCLICDMLTAELSAEVRVVAQNEQFVCIIPYFARFPYEAHVISRRHLGSIAELSSDETLAFGKMLQALVRGYDRLFGFTTAYIMAVHQAPTDGGDHSTYHFHVEFYPAHADEKTLKHLSGTEIGIDVFVNPADVEANAARLRRAISRL